MNIEQRPQLDKAESGNASGQPSFNVLDLLKEGMSNKRKDDTANSPITGARQDSEMQAGWGRGKQAEESEDKGSRSTDKDNDSTDKSGNYDSEKRGEQPQGNSDKSDSIQEIIDEYSPEDDPDANPQDPDECERDRETDGGQEFDPPEQIDSVPQEGPVTIEKPGSVPEVKNGPIVENTPYEHSVPRGSQPQVLEFTNPFSGK